MRIALIDAVKVLHTWHTVSGEVATRYDLPNGNQISPVKLGWSDDDYSIVEVVPFEIPEGMQIVGNASYEIIDGQAVETYPIDDIPIRRRLVRKSTITARLINAGKMVDAHNVLMANPINFARWIASDKPAIYYDDPDAIALLTAIGADVEAIMAEDDE